MHIRPNAPTCSLRILLAVNDRITQRIIAKILERAGHETAIAESEEQALDGLESASFDLALMDIDQPMMNGIEAAKLYRFLSLGQKRVPIVALTASPTAEAAKLCGETGMDACLANPVESAQLLAIIHRVISDTSAQLPDGSRTGQARFRALRL